MSKFIKPRSLLFANNKILKKPGDSLKYFTTVKTPQTNDPHTDPKPIKPNELEGEINKPRDPNPDPFPNNPKKEKPEDFPIPDELYPQPI